MENPDLSKTTFKKKRPRTAKNRLLLMESTPNNSQLLAKVKPKSVVPEKEKIYEEIMKLRLLSNSYKEEVMQHKGRIRQQLEHLNERDALIMELTAKIDKPGYKKIHEISELRLRLRKAEMELEDVLTGLKNGRIGKPEKDIEENEEKIRNLMKDNEDKQEYCKTLTEKINTLTAEKKGLSDSNEELIKKIRDLEKLTRGKEGLSKKIKELEAELKEKDEISKEQENLYKEEREKNQELKKKTGEFEELNKNLLIQCDKLKDEVIGLRRELEGYKKIAKEKENERIRVKICKGENFYCQKNKKYFLNLSSPLQHFLYCLQLGRIYPDDIRKTLFGVSLDMMKISIFQLSQSFNNPAFWFAKNKSIMDELVKDLIGNDKESTIKDVLNRVDVKLGKWVVYEKSEQDELELKFLRVVLVKYQEIFEECLKFDESQKGSIGVSEFFSALTITGTFLPNYLSNYICLLFYSISHELNSVPYKDFLPSYLNNISILTSSDLEFISKHYIQKIVHCSKTQNKKISKHFESSKGKIFSESFKSGCFSLGVKIEIPIINVVLKFYGDEKKNGEFFIKKKNFFEVLKKFGYVEDKDWSSSSSNSSFKVVDKVEEVKVEKQEENVIIRNFGIAQSVVGKSKEQPFDVDKFKSGQSFSDSSSEPKRSSESYSKSFESSRSSKKSKGKIEKSPKESIDSKNSSKSIKSSQKSIIKNEKSSISSSSSNKLNKESSKISESSSKSKKKTSNKPEKSLDSSKSSNKLPKKLSNSSESSSKSSTSKKQEKSPKSSKSSISKKLKASLKSSKSSEKVPKKYSESSKSSKKTSNKLEKSPKSSKSSKKVPKPLSESCGSSSKSPKEISSKPEKSPKSGKFSNKLAKKHSEKSESSSEYAKLPDNSKSSSKKHEKSFIDSQYSKKSFNKGEKSSESSKSYLKKHQKKSESSESSKKAIKITENSPKSSKFLVKVIKKHSEKSESSENSSKKSKSQKSKNSIKSPKKVSDDIIISQKKSSIKSKSSNSSPSSSKKNNEKNPIASQIQDKNKEKSPKSKKSSKRSSKINKSSSDSSKSYVGSSKKAQEQQKDQRPFIINQPIPFDKLFKDEKIQENPQSTRYRSDEENQGFDKTNTMFKVTQIQGNQEFNPIKIQNLVKSPSNASEKSLKNKNSDKSSDELYEDSFDDTSSSEYIENSSVKDKSYLSFNPEINKPPIFSFPVINKEKSERNITSSKSPSSSSSKTSSKDKIFKKEEKEEKIEKKEEKKEEKIEKKEEIIDKKEEKKEEIIDKKEEIIDKKEEIIDKKEEKNEGENNEKTSSSDSDSYISSDTESESSSSDSNSSSKSESSEVSKTSSVEPSFVGSESGSSSSSSSLSDSNYSSSSDSKNKKK